MDQAFQAVGEHGPFQKMTIIIVSISSLLVTIYTLSFSYLTKLPEFLCKDTSFPNAQFHECKYSQELCNSNIEMIKNPETSVKNWAYDFDLYCSREYYNDLISTSFFTGGIIGTITFSSLPRRDAATGLRYMIYPKVLEYRKVVRYKIWSISIPTTRSTHLSRSRTLMIPTSATRTTLCSAPRRA